MEDLPLGRIAALVPEFAVNDLPMSRTLMMMMKVKVFPLQAMKAQGDVDARVHTFAANALRRGRVANPMLDHLYPPVLILQEAEWIPGPV